MCSLSPEVDEGKSEARKEIRDPLSLCVPDVQNRQTLWSPKASQWWPGAGDRK